MMEFCPDCGEPLDLIGGEFSSPHCANCGWLEGADDDDQHEAVVDAAKRLHEKPGDLEFDDDAAVSWSADGGAYVQCWKWLSDEDLAQAGIRNPEADALYASVFGEA